MKILYDPKEIESKWQKIWEKEKIFKTIENYSLKKYYLLEMFPYPSGKIHMGHVRVYTIGDVIARYKRMCGYNVLHPMGWDAFGMPAENAALESNIHPAKWTYDNIDHMRLQLKKLGFSYDWNREITTCKPEYYRWEQWLFIKMLKRDMVYRKEAYVNWCKKCETVLANEQVNSGLCWRCGSTILQKKLWQWFFRIKDYADDLLMHCDQLSGWPEKVIRMQKNWIGKSFGIKINFRIENTDKEITIFTTRPETIYGATFISIAPEHPIIKTLYDKCGQKNSILNFIKKISNYDRFEKKDAYDKEGIFTGAYCLNPLSNEKIPIYVVNFVLMNHGTGAIMSVPAHDHRDYEFAKKYNLPIKAVIRPEIKSKKSKIYFNEKPFTEKGIMINSGLFNNLSSSEASKKIVKYVEENNFGSRTISFRLRDWGISRQRYWGTPIPIIHCKYCGIVSVKEEDLPIILPDDSSISRKTILNSFDKFVKVSCPSCGYDNAKRETDTMDTFVESSWYFERFCSPDYNKGIFNEKAVNYWMPIDQYIGGIEHAILHLLYARYFTRVLNKLGLIKYKEPFSRVLTQGMICKETFKCPNHGFLFPEETVTKNDDINCIKCGELVEIGRVQKMSKSKKNVIDPDILINNYGADTVRLFCLFTAPPEKDLEWNDQGIEGSSKFLKRIWRLKLSWIKLIINISSNDFKIKLISNQFFELLQKTHETIKQVTKNIEKRFHFNTAISSIMELVNFMYTIKFSGSTNSDKSVMKFSLETVILLLYPMVPHFCEELWHDIENKTPLSKKNWPIYDENIILKNNIILVIQINGKLRSKIQIKRDMPETEIKAIALSNSRVNEFIKNKKIIKTIFIKNKLLNIVVK